MRIKSGPPGGASVGKQPLTASAPGGVKPVPAAVDPAPPPGNGEAKPDMGPATIRLKRPDGQKAGTASHFGGETSRISLGSPAVAHEEVQSAPRTVKIKRPAGAGDAVEEATPLSGRKTMKIARPGGKPVEKSEPEGQAPEDATLTQKRTLSIKRQEQVPVTDHMSKMMQDEALLKGKAKKRWGRSASASASTSVPVEEGGKPPERLAWAWCVVSLVPAIVIGLVMWVFWVQLRPTVERKHNWPGRILNSSDSFYRSEPEWKVF